VAERDDTIVEPRRGREPARTEFPFRGVTASFGREIIGADKACWTVAVQYAFRNGTIGRECQGKTAADPGGAINNLQAKSASCAACGLN